MIPDSFKSVLKDGTEQILASIPDSKKESLSSLLRKAQKLPMPFPLLKFVGRLADELRPQAPPREAQAPDGAQARALEALRAQAQATGEARARAKAQAREEAEEKERKTQAEEEEKAKAQGRADARARKEAKAKEEAELKAAQKAEAEPKAKTQAKARTEPKAEPKTEPKAKAKAEPKTEPKAEPKAEPKTEAKSQPQKKEKGNAAKSETWSEAQFEVEPVEGKTRFQDLSLPPCIMQGIQEAGFEYCTEIQAQSLPQALSGRDVFGKAQTGTGKTAAFLLTIMKHVIDNPITDQKPGWPRALVVAPTRELAIQIDRDANMLGKYCDVTTFAVFGGMDYEKQQTHVQRKPVDIIVATPGRLLDFNRRRDINLGKVEILVIDEADRMLDMGFIPDINDIVRSTPPKEKRQTLLYGATLTEQIHELGRRYTNNPHVIEIAPEHITNEDVEQIVYIVTQREKLNLLVNLIHQQDLARVIVFTNRRDETRWLTDRLREYGFSTEILSGDINQNRRLRTLDKFKDGKIRVLVATDVAGRGIHIDGLSHVINYHLPLNAEDYVHRIGRTGRAGSTGVSVSFADEEDGHQIPIIEAYIEAPLPCTQPPENWLEKPPLERRKLSESEREQRPPDPRRRRSGPPPRGGRGGSGGSSGGRRR